MTTDKTPPMDRWNIIPWKKIERNVYKLQKRIYQASQGGTDDNCQVTEEPCEVKASRTVLEPSLGW